jgi:RNA polymerase sigma-70 factor, ECF subfamily
MACDEPQTTELLRRARRGDKSAVERLLQVHRDRLRRMVVVHLDRRLAVRVDPSDIVQEALVEAARKLPDYLEQRPLPFYPWLRRLALENLLQMRQRHVDARKRSVHREQAADLGLSDESMNALADRFVASGTHPSERLVREELRNRVRAALAELPPRDREVLVVRYLEQHAPREAAAALGIGQAAFMKRHLRAIQRLRRRLDHNEDGGSR